VLGDDAERTDGRQHAGLGAVDVVDAIAIADAFSLAAVWQVEVACEHVARVALPTIRRTATATAAAIGVTASVATIVTGVVAWIVAIQHGPFPSVTSPEYRSFGQGAQSIV
jgi:hypothetical protein